MNRVYYYLTQPFIWLVVGYQKTLSPDHGWLKVFYPHGYCPYHPSCSEYTRQALVRYGLVAGVLKGTGRLLRCHPWARGGVDTP